ncbi:MAG: hypothetical protein IJ719_19660 [Clostridia bacterium]|nr:hypothetical protein [Clostridia bacterium]
MEPTQREAVLPIISMQQSIIARTPEGDIARKITPDHITQMLNNDKTAIDYQHEDSKQEKMVNIIYVVIVAAVILLLSLMLKDEHADLLSEILKLLLATGLGGLGGYGLSKSKQN